MKTTMRLCFAQRLRSTGRLIGWNIGRGSFYSPPHDPLHPEWRTSERAAALKEFASSARPANGALPWMRFSGLQIDGMMGADGYHFWDFVDPAHRASEGDNMATFQYMAMIEESAAEPVVLLNFSSGTAAEAARYVTHLNGTNAKDPLVAARHHWGRTEPWGQKLFEVGNENYGPWNTSHNAFGPASYANPNAVHGGDPHWHGKPSDDPAVFGARALEYIRAVLAVEPEAHFWVPLANADMESWGGIETSIPQLKPLLEHPAVQAVMIHHYHVDDAVFFGLSNKNDPAFILGGTERYRPEFHKLRALLNGLERAVPMQIGITEYHVAGAFARNIFTLGESPLVGLGLAEMLIFYAQLGVEHACQHMALEFSNIEGREQLFQTWYNPFRSDGEGGVRHSHGFFATSMFARHMLDQMFVVDIEQGPTQTYALREESFVYPLLHAAGFVNEEETQGSLVLLNRDLEHAQAISLVLPEGWTLVSASMIAPEQLDTEIAPELLALAWEVDESGACCAVLPPHSLAGFWFARLEREEV